MNAEQLAALEAEVNGAVDTAASIASVVAPQYAGFIVLGQAMAHLAPKLYADVAALLSSQNPTDADKAALAASIAAWANPGAI